jgi:quinol monooxygenase YgiN
MYTLIAKWTIKQGQETPALNALKSLGREVLQNEKDTLIYLVHTPDLKEASLPTPSPLEVVFFEVYRNKTAFLAHVNGPTFTNFVKQYGALFLSTTVQCADGGSSTNPFVLAEVLTRKAGFIREEAGTSPFTKNRSKDQQR